MTDCVLMSEAKAHESMLGKKILYKLEFILTSYMSAYCKYTVVIQIKVMHNICRPPGADPGFCVRGDDIRQGDLRVLLLFSQMFMERMMQEN